MLLRALSHGARLGQVPDAACANAAWLGSNGAWATVRMRTSTGGATAQVMCGVDEEQRADAMELLKRGDVVCTLMDVSVGRQGFVFGWQGVPYHRPQVHQGHSGAQWLLHEPVHWQLL